MLGYERLPTYDSKNRAAAAQFLSSVPIARPAAAASTFPHSILTPCEKLRLEKPDVGGVNPVGRTRRAIAVARKRQEGANTVITIVTARNMPFVELYNNGRTTDYPSGYMQVKLNDKGVGTGQIMAAARIRFDKKKGNYEIESYSNQQARCRTG